MLNANKFVYHNFYIQPPKSACDSSKTLQFYKEG